MGITIPSAGTPIGVMDIVNGTVASVNGNSIPLFEETVKTFSGKKFCFFVNSGTTALLVTLKVLKTISDRSEVILPAYTAPSLILPIKKSMLKPVLCDISLDTFNADLERLEGTITDKTLCVIPVHMFGLACDMKRISGIARKKGAYVVEDAASSLGSKLNAMVTGSFGDIGFYSFNRGKNLSTFAGGCLVTDNDDIAGLIEKEIAKLPSLSLKSKIKIMVKTVALSLAVRPVLFTLLHSIISRFKHNTLHPDFESFEYTTFQAGLGYSLFQRSNYIFENRNKKGMFLYDSLKGLNGIKLPEILHDSNPVFNQFPLLIDDQERRDFLFDEISRIGVECTILYPYPVHKSHDLGYDLSRDPFKNASYMAERLLLIPTHHFVSMSKLEDIVELIRSKS